MNKKKFFETTRLYKEFIILDMIEKNKNITQRKISNYLDVAVSVVNNYLDIFEENNLIKRNHFSTKTVEYLVTKKGNERKKILNISYLRDSLKIFKSASKEVVDFFNQIFEKGFKKIILYGAGEVSEILLQTFAVEKNIPIKIMGIIDDDISKHNTRLIGFKINSVKLLSEIEHDGVLISSYTKRNEISTKLLNLRYEKNKIIEFFD